MKYTFSLILATTLSLGGCTQLHLIGSTDTTRKLAQKADTGNTDAQYQLGLQFTAGADTEQNYAKGLYYFRQAAESEHTDAQYMAGMGYYLGRGTAQDYGEARRWLESAAVKQHREAMHYLGEIYFNGYGTKAEPAWGIHWIGQSAERGYSESQYLLGISYLTGIGSPRNRTEGLRWMSIANANGSLRAKEMLEEMGSKPQRIDFQPVTNQLDALRTRYQTRYAQIRLNELGQNAGYADGIWGERTASASRRLLKRNASLRELIEALRSRPEKGAD